MSTAPLATDAVASSPTTWRGPPSAGLGIVRPAAVAALCGAALLAARVAEATGRLDDGPTGALFARLDVASTVLLVLGVTVAARPIAGRLLDGRRPLSWRAYAARWLLPLYALWIPIVVLDQVIVDPARGGRAMVTSMVLFRDPRGVPVAGLGIGPLLTVLAMTIVLLPLADRLLRRGRPVGLGSILRPAGGLVVAGLVVRGALVVADRTAPFGATSWLPAHLDAVGAGVAIAALHATGRLAGACRARIVSWAIVGAVVALLVAMATLPRSTLFTGRGDVWLGAALSLLVATGTVLAVSTMRSGNGRLAGSLAVAAPGLVLAGEMAFIALARQYRDAEIDGPLGLRLTGPALPVWLWSLAVSAAIGVLLTAIILIPLWRWLAGAWPRHRYPIALAAVVAGGMLVRVATWLTIAPEKTDGGDPLYYHVTANVLAAGRGFPEPLNWLDSQTSIASAVHGPLYPIVLSISSRLGGTTYVDHKFVSILVGTATVLLTALVAERLGGRRAALVAGTLAAVYPNLWLIDSLLFPEGLFAMLTTGSILIAYRWRDRPTWWRAALLGAAIGLAGLTRGEGLLLVPLLALPWILGDRDLAMRQRWKHLAVVGAGCVAVLAPWTIRNATTFDVFVPLSTNGNELIMYANCDDTYSGRLIGFWSFACQERYRAEFGEPLGDEAEKAAFWQDVGIDYARDHLGEVPKVVAVRVLRQWELFRPWQTVEFSSIENRDQDSARAGLAMYYVLVAAAIAGAVVLHRRRERLLPLVAQVVSVTITAAYAYGTVRFRAPVEPVLCILAGVFAVAVLRPGRTRRDEHRPVATGSTGSF